MGRKIGPIHNVIFSIFENFISLPLSNSNWDFLDMPIFFCFLLIRGYHSRYFPSPLEFELRLSRYANFLSFSPYQRLSLQIPPTFPPAQSAGKFFSKEIPNKKILLQIPSPSFPQKKRTRGRGWRYLEWYLLIWLHHCRKYVFLMLPQKKQVKLKLNSFDWNNCEQLYYLS